MKKTLLILAAAAAVAACTPKQRWHRDEGAAWGTLYHITYHATASLHDSIRAVMREVELSVSPFEPASALTAFNAGRSDRLDAMAAGLVAESQRVWHLSGGMFDPTVMPLVELWGFGPGGQTSEPTQAQIDSALAMVGLGECRMKPDGSFVRKHPHTRLDFSSIAKGAGVDAVAAMLRRNGAERYMVEIGGEVATGGMNPRGERWRIQVDAPADDPEGLRHDRLLMLNLDGGRCVATSGNYRNYRLLADGGRTGHIISPLTGRNVPSAVLSATVTAPSCLLADAMATAAMLMPPENALAMADSLPGTAILLAVADPAAPDSMCILSTRGFPEPLMLPTVAKPD